MGNQGVGRNSCGFWKEVTLANTVAYNSEEKFLIKVNRFIFSTILNLFYENNKEEG